MILWRISNHANLSGIGGVKARGRWNSKGRRVVYLAEHPALAMLEVLAHLETGMDKLPDRMQFLKVDISDQASLKTLPEDFLASRWPARLGMTRRRGDHWLNERSSLLLKVPSVVAPESWNYLFNPLHPEAGLAMITRTFSHLLDRRLPQGRSGER